MLKRENTPEIETTRLRLRKVTLQDADALLAIYQVEGIHRYRPWIPFTTISQVKAYIKKRIYPVYQENLGYFYAIEDKLDHQVIGFISIVGIDENLCKGEIEYGLLKSYWDGGYAKEAGEAVLKKAKENGFASVSISQSTEVPYCGKLMELIKMRYRYSFQMRKPGKLMITYRYYQIDFD